MTPFRWAVAFWAGGGMLAFTLWTVRLFATTELQPGADRTTWLAWQCGRAFVWLGALAAAGGVFGVIARAAWSLLAG